VKAHTSKAATAWPCDANDDNESDRKTGNNNVVITVLLGNYKEKEIDGN